MKPIVTDPAPAVTGFDVDVRTYGGTAMLAAAFRLERVWTLNRRTCSSSAR
jgi:hypothetical protein